MVCGVWLLEQEWYALSGAADPRKLKHTKHTQRCHCVKTRPLLHADHLHPLIKPLFVCGCIQRAARTVVVTFWRENKRKQKQQAKGAQTLRWCHGRNTSLGNKLKLWKRYGRGMIWCWMQRFTDSAKLWWERMRENQDGSILLNDDLYKKSRDGATTFPVLYSHGAGWTVAAGSWSTQHHQADRLGGGFQSHSRLVWSS